MLSECTIYQSLKGQLDKIILLMLSKKLLKIVMIRVKIELTKIYIFFIASSFFNNTNSTQSNRKRITLCFFNFIKLAKLLNNLRTVLFFKNDNKSDF